MKINKYLKAEEMAKLSSQNERYNSIETNKIFYIIIEECVEQAMLGRYEAFIESTDFKHGFDVNKLIKMFTDKGYYVQYNELLYTLKVCWDNAKKQEV
jgi:soluble cytochrome b562